MPINKEIIQAHYDGFVARDFDASGGPSGEFSTGLKMGSTSLHDHPALPAAAQPS